MHNAHNRDRDGSLLVNIQSRVLASLSDLLTEFFHQMDDAFFDRAEQAATNNEQNMYFEAMRELRMHARDVDNELRKELAFQFDLLSKKQLNLLSECIRFLLPHMSQMPVPTCKENTAG